MTGGKPAADLSAVRAMVARAKPIPSRRRFEGDPKPGNNLNGIEPGRWEPDALGLPDGCPVVPLGISGNVAWFIDPIGQVQEISPPYGKGHLLGLFCGRANYLTWAWPRFGKKGIDGYAAEEASAALIGACAAKGPWNSVDKIRGRGAWLSRGGSLVVHTGTDLLIGGRREPPGEIEGFVYPTRPPIAGPWPQPVEEHENPARLLLPMLRTWQWARPDVDPMLLLGWIGAAMIGGALEWRPSVYITGDAATGKSSLQRLLKYLFNEALIQAADTTAAGIYQHVGQDSLPVAVDEFEGQADTRKARAVLHLARQAASGSLMLRGGDRHNPVQFTARSCFLFSSINTPPLEPQDLSRLAILRLGRLPAGQPPPVLDQESLSIVGQCVLRRMIDEWHRFGETWSAFKGELARGGLDGRGQEQFGTLLACADMISHDGWDEDRLRFAASEGDLVPWSEMMAVGGLAEYEDRAENWRLCLSHLLSVRVDAWRSGTRHAVGQLIEEFWNSSEGMTLTLAKTMLGQAGLTIINRKSGPRDWWLAVPNNNPLTRSLFEGSKWAGDIGAGVWAGALRQSPEGAIHEVGRARINGDAQRCTLISLAGLYGDGGIMIEPPDPSPAPSPVNGAFPTS